jgi:site-specific recombinase XerD
LSTSKLMRHASVATTQGYTELRRDRLEDILGQVV